MIHKIKQFDLEAFLSTFKKKIKKEDFSILVAVFVFGFLNFYFFLSHTVLSPDGLTYGPLYKSGRWEFQLGRPLLAIIDRMRGGLVSPPIILFFSLLYVAISIMFLRRIFSIKGKLSLFILSLLFVLFPTISNVSLYIYCLDGYCLALLFSIISLYFIQNKKYLLSILFTIASLSLYQAFISITITGVLLLFVLDIIDNKESIKGFMKQMIFIFIGLVLYFILLKIGMIIFDLNLADYKGASAFGLTTILSMPQSIINAYQDFYSFFITDAILFNHYYHRNIINLILLGLSICIMIPNIKHLNIKKASLILISLLLIPITICIMDLIACQTKIMINTAIGFSMMYVFILIIHDRYSFPFLKSITYILLFILSFTYLLSNNGTFQVRVDVYNHYYANSLNILTRVKSLDGYSPDYPWMFNNTINYTSPVWEASNDMSSNFLETFYGYLGVKENEYFYKRFLGEKIFVIEEDQYQEMKKKDEFKQMKKGDIKIIDGVIVIKVSDEDI